MTQPDVDTVITFLRDLQDRVCADIETQEGGDHGGFREDVWERPGGGSGRSRVLEDGSVIEKGGVNFSHVLGDRLPPPATARRPELEGRGFEAMGVSVIFQSGWKAEKCTGTLGPRFSLIHAASSWSSLSESFSPGIRSVVISNQTSVSCRRYLSVSRTLAR